LHAVRLSEFPLRCLAFGPGDAWLAVGGSDGTLRLCDPETGKVRTSWDGGQGETRSIAVSPRGDVVATAGKDVRLWFVERKELLGALTRHEGPVNAVDFSPDGRLLASGGDDRTINVVDLVELRSRLTELGLDWHDRPGDQ
jgi:WD40 repeat protein